MTDSTAPVDVAGRPEEPARGLARPRRVQAPKTEFAFMPHLATAVVVGLTLALLPPGPGLAVLSITSALLAVGITVGRGGAYLPPSSVFFLASGVFVGGGAYYLGIVDTPVAQASLRDATALALLSTVGISAVVTALTIGWRLQWPVRSEEDLDREDVRPPPQFALKGLLMVGIALVPLTEAFIGPPAGSIGVGGIVILVLWASSRRLHLRWYGDVLIVALAVVLPYLWVTLTFKGGGRLMIAGISIAAFVGWNLISPRRAQKLLVILAIPGFLAFAGLNRIARADDTSASAGSVVSGGDGLASVYSPLETWTRMIEPLPPEQAEMLGPRYGETFLNTLVLPVPRSLWEDKPKGFGAELTEVFEPQLVPADHSMAGLMHGEWYANFGFAGLVLLIPVIGVFLALLDRRHARLAWTGFTGPRMWWRAAVLMCIVSSLADLYWVGSFMLFARGGLSAVAVAVVGHLSLTRKPRSRSHDMSPGTHRRSVTPAAGGG